MSLELVLAVAARDAYKWGYEYLQGRMESIGRRGWAQDCDGEIGARINDSRANYALALRNAPPPCTKRHYVVIGRMHGDKENSSMEFFCESREEAVQGFTDEMWTYEAVCKTWKMTEAELEQAKVMADANGTGVYIDHVLCSASVINEV